MDLENILIFGPVGSIFTKIQVDINETEEKVFLFDS